MRIAFLGDIALIGKYDSTKYAMEKIEKRLDSIKQILSTCDFVVANLESPFTNVITTKEAKTLPLRSEPKNVEVLQYLGVDAVSIANNHFFDYGQIGAIECLDVLEKANIQWFGIDGKACTLVKNKESITIGGFCCHTTNAWHYDDMSHVKEHMLNTLTIDNVNRFLNSVKTGYPVLYFHWGEENTHFPKKEHIEISNQILDNYHTTIIGHHPHVIQGIQKYKCGDVLYSLGNFCFDDCKSTTKSNVSVQQTEDNLIGYFAILEIDSESNINYQIIPYRDTDIGLIIDNQLVKEIEQYGKKINEGKDWIAYEARRRYEQQSAFHKRLGRRNIHWLLGHMNLTAVKAVLQRKKNEVGFQEEIKQILPKYKLCEPKKIGIDRKVILYIGNFDRPDKSAAGKRVFGNAKIFEMLGYTVYLVGKESQYDERTQYSNHIYFYSFPGISFYKIKAYRKWLEKFILEKNINPQAIIRYGSPGLAIVDMDLQKWCKRNNIKIIADVVDWLSADGGNIIFNLIKTVDTFLEKAIFNKQCDGLIAISSYLHNYYRGYKKRIITIPPLVDNVKENSTENEFVKIVYAGNPFRKKVKVKNVHKVKDRLDLCVKAISKVSETQNVQFHIFGMTKEDYLMAFPTHTEEVKCNNIYFHGRCPMKEVQSFIQTSDFTILLRECTRATMAGFPTKVVESISCGTPVITTDTTDLKLLLEENKEIIFVDIENQETLIKQMKAICSLKKSDIKKMKNECAMSDVFLYKNYIETMKIFLEEIKLEGKN